jgi:hypothetical protein
MITSAVTGEHALFVRRRAMTFQRAEAAKTSLTGKIGQMSVSRGRKSEIANSDRATSKFVERRMLEIPSRKYPPLF